MAFPWCPPKSNKVCRRLKGRQFCLLSVDIAGPFYRTILAPLLRRCHRRLKKWDPTYFGEILASLKIFIIETQWFPFHYVAAEYTEYSDVCRWSPRCLIFAGNTLACCTLLKVHQPWDLWSQPTGHAWQHCKPRRGSSRDTQSSTNPWNVSNFLKLIARNCQKSHQQLPGPR